MGLGQDIATEVQLTVTDPFPLYRVEVLREKVVFVINDYFYYLVHGKKSYSRNSS